MAKRPAAKVRHVPLALLALALSPGAKAEWKFTPTVDLRQSYSDNVNLAREELARAQFYTEIAPGFTLLNNSPRWKMRTTYARNFFLSKDDDIPNTQRAHSELSAAVDGRLINDLLFLDAEARIGQQAVSAFGPQSNGNNFTNNNKAEVRSFRASPYLRYRFGSTANMELRYTRDSLDTGRSTGLGNSDGNTYNLNLSSGPTFRRFGWSLTMARQEVSYSLVPDSTVDNANLGLRYLLSNTFTATMGLGHDSYDYDALGGRTQGRSWSVGFDWKPSSRTSLQASAGKRYYGSSYMLNAQHRSRSTVWSINYNDAVTTTRAQFLLPSTIDTASMLDGLFTATIPDPVARAAAVQAYIAATGLPPSLADNINYFSNRFILQKQLQASVAFSTSRTTTILSLFDTRRNALSNIKADSPLQGSQSVNLNDDTRQQGANASLNWRINARSSVNLILSAGTSISNSTGQEVDNRAVRLGVTSQIKPRLRGSLEVRRVSGSTLGIASDYRENGVSAILSMSL
jgi:uncharacterized protein (PEP-CTERM system associated)